MVQKLDYSYVKEFVENRGHTLLTDTYTNCKVKLPIRCENGHKYDAPFISFKRGHGCPVCYGNKKHSYKQVKEIINSIGYTLLSNTYKNINSKLLVKCDKDHEYEVSFHNFQQGNRCPVCSCKIKHTYEYVKTYIKDEGYTLISDTYKNINSRLLVKCDKDHEYGVSFHNFQQGNRCPVCYGNIKHTYKYIKEFVDETGYTLLSDTYDNIRTKLLVKCDKDHEYEVLFSSFRNGCRCPICASNNRSSKGEMEVQGYLKSLGIPIVKNDRTQIINPKTGKNLELDIWIPSMNKAIEYNGLYWHSLFEKQTNDKIKIEQCKLLGIDLLVVGEFNWINNNSFERELIRIFVSR